MVTTHYKTNDMKTEVLKTIEKLEEMLDFMVEDGDLTDDKQIKILDRLEEIKKELD